MEQTQRGRRSRFRWKLLTAEDLVGWAGNFLHSVWPETLLCQAKSREQFHRWMESSEFLRWTIPTIGTWFTPTPPPPPIHPTNTRNIPKIPTHAFDRHTKLCVVCFEKLVQVVHIINKPATQPRRRFKRDRWQRFSPRQTYRSWGSGQGRSLISPYKTCERLTQ